MPPAPEISSFLTVGFNSTNRSLEAQSHILTPAALRTQDLSTGTGNESSLARSHPNSASLEQLVAVFVAQSDRHSAMLSHLPLLVSNASLAVPTKPAIRLVSLPKGATKRLSVALHLPHVSIIGLKDNAQSATSLLTYIRDNVSPVEVPWLKDLVAGVYLPTYIKASVTTAPVKLDPKHTSKALPKS